MRRWGWDPLPSFWAQRSRSSLLQPKASGPCLLGSEALQNRPQGLRPSLPPCSLQKPPEILLGTAEVPLNPSLPAPPHPPRLPMPCPQAVQHGCSGIPAGWWTLLGRWLRRVMKVTQASHFGVPSQGKESTQGGAVRFPGAQRLTGIVQPQLPTYMGEGGSGGGGREPRSLAEKLRPSWTLPALPLHYHPFTLFQKAGGDPGA